MKKYLQLKSVLLLLIMSTSCYGQNGSGLTNENLRPLGLNWEDKDPYFTGTTTITSPHGPRNITRNVLQDRKGNIWLASWEGIMRYDGKSFTNFTNKLGLRRYHVFSILEDRKGNLWFGTIGAGVYRYDGKEFTNITTKDGLVNDKITCFYEDKVGNIWIGTVGGLSIYDGKSIQNYTTEEGLINNDVNSIVEDKKGRFWFGSRGAAFFYDPNLSGGSEKTFTTFTSPEGKTFVNVRSVIEDREGNIWLGGNAGLWRYDGRSLTQYAKSFVGYIYEDKQGNIWTSAVATRDSWVLSSVGNARRQSWALSRYEQENLSDPAISPTLIRQAEDMFFGITEDTNGGIWLGSLQGVGRYDGKSWDLFEAAGKKD